MSGHSSNNALNTFDVWTENSSISHGICPSIDQNLLFGLTINNIDTDGGQ